MRRWHAAEESNNFSGKIEELKTETRKLWLGVIDGYFLRQFESSPEWSPYPGCPGAQEPETDR